MKEVKVGESYTCPVCGEYTFESAGEFDICEVCGWEDDIVQLEDPDEDMCANYMSLNEAHEAYKMGIGWEDADDIKHIIDKMTFSEALKAFKEGRKIE